MDLVFDVGNTETVIGWFQDTELRGHWRVSTDGRRTADEYGLMLMQLLAAAGVGGVPVRAATIGSVVPALTLTLADACRRYLGAEVNAVNASTPLPIRLDVDEPMTVGADRIVNTLAALRMFAVDTPRRSTASPATACSSAASSRRGSRRRPATSPSARPSCPAWSSCRPSA
jgi:type III pantothenate kinase